MHFLQLILVASIGVILVSSSAAGSEKRFIKTAANTPGQWMTEGEMLELIRNGQKFMDVTDSKYSENNSNQVVRAPAIPLKLTKQEKIAQVLTKLDRTRQVDFLTQFTSYHNRYYASETGQESQFWLFNEVKATIEQYGRNYTVEEVDHGFPQKSVIVRIEGSHPDLKSEVVIVGAHLDSINGANTSFSAPGADDNGSGSLVTMEVFRAFADMGQVFSRSVEFHWYAAEEIGLVGSQKIAEMYRENNVTVAGMLNLDVIGFHIEGVDEIAIFTDYASPDLVAFVQSLASRYVFYGWIEKTCGYGCSDHASWTENGFPAIFVGAAQGSPDHHTANDTMAIVNFDQVTQFLYLTVGFVMELTE